MKHPVVTVCLPALLFWAGCHKPGENVTPEETGPAPTAIAVIPKGTTHEFWKSVHAGALQAKADLAAEGVAVDIIWKGPLREDDRELQMQVVEGFTTRGVKGIVLAPLDSKALVPAVETAASAGIPTVIIDSDLMTTQQVSFVATDNFRGGQLAGEHLASLLGEQGKVILLRYAVGSASTEQREAGFLEVLTNRFPGLELISSDQYGNATRETAYQASQNLLNRFGRDVNGIFCPNETTTLGMLKALKDIGRAGGDVKMVGFDANTVSVSDLREGHLQGLIVQNPFRMGYEGVKAVVAHLRGESVPRRIDTGVTLVTPENMDQPEIRQLLQPPSTD